MKPEAPPTWTDADEATRVRLGASPNTAAHVLEHLAADSSATVRAALAMNPAAPPQANHMLAQDADVRVRVLLARKLAGLIPSLPGEDQATLQVQAFATLTALVEDEALRVRAAVADAVKDMPAAPRALVLRLAQDQAVMVSEPVIRLSPLLTTSDLLGLLAGSPPPATVLAVSRRQQVEEAVSDAVAATANALAIRAMLANPSAQIREATLDAIVARAVEHVEWHEPLVRRPTLSANAARALSEIVATHLLEVLAQRQDLEPAVSGEVRKRLEARLSEPAAAPRGQEDGTTDVALTRARALAAEGELTEVSLLDAAHAGETRLVSALLAVAAGLPISVVDRAATLRSAKGLVSLAWKAGFTMRVGVAVQAVLARLGPGTVLVPGPGGSFPLAVEEMRWQLEFLGRMGR